VGLNAREQTCGYVGLTLGIWRYSLKNMGAMIEEHTVLFGSIKGKTTWIAST